MNTLDIYKLVAQSQAHDQRKKDHYGKAKLLHFDETDARLTTLRDTDSLTSDDVIANPHALTDNALKDLCTKLAPAVYGAGTNAELPYRYLAAVPKDVLAYALNSHTQRVNGRRWLLRAYDNNIRAVLGSEYARGGNKDGEFENTRLLKVLARFLESDPALMGNVEIVRPSVGADNIHVKFAFSPEILKNAGLKVDESRYDDGNGGIYKLGAYIRNDELGHGSIALHPFTQRTSCENSVRYDKDAVVIRHNATMFEAMLVQIMVGMANVLQSSVEIVDRMIAAERERIPSFSMVLAGIAIEKGWAEETVRIVEYGTEGKQTRAGLVHGVSYAAHSLPQRDAEAENDMELLAGQILYMTIGDLARMEKVAVERLKI